MKKTLFWLQCGGCGGDTWSMYNIESPNLAELFTSLDIDILWHPSISVKSGADQQKLVFDVLSGNQHLDFLCIEGAIIRGPKGTGLYDLINGKPKKDLVAALARKAQYVFFSGPGGRKFWRRQRNRSHGHAIFKVGKRGVCRQIISIQKRPARN